MSFVLVRTRREIILDFVHYASPPAHTVQLVLPIDCVAGFASTVVPLAAGGDCGARVCNTLR
jgi:hypothetical protein